MTIRTPESQHRQSHRRPDVEPADCWQCQREKAKCRSKRRFVDYEEGRDAADARNEATEYRLMLATYPCPWCRCYHHTRAKPGTARWKRVEKRRRKWLQGR